MSKQILTVALISDVFYDDNPAQRLLDRLGEAKARGATLAVLPEIPVNPWSPATKNLREEDAEAPRGERHQMQADAAKEVGISLVGGVIIREPDTGRRFNTALAFDATGTLLGTHQKWHIPEEEGFWETSHYRAGVQELSVIKGMGATPGEVPGEAPGVIPGATIGLQICSDINRPEGAHLLGAMGAQIICAPRATELATYEKWRPVFQANAFTSCTYLVSVNRPAPEQGVLLGGPSIAVSYDSKVLLESTDPVSVVELDLSRLPQARIDYPGYLPVRAADYAAAWAKIAQGTG